MRDALRAVQCGGNLFPGARQLGEVGIVKSGFDAREIKSLVVAGRFDFLTGNEHITVADAAKLGRARQRQYAHDAQGHRGLPKQTDDAGARDGIEAGVRVQTRMHAIPILVQKCLYQLQPLGKALPSVGAQQGDGKAHGHAQVAGSFAQV